MERGNIGTETCRIVERSEKLETKVGVTARADSFQVHSSTVTGGWGMRARVINHGTSIVERHYQHRRDRFLQ